MVTRIPFEEITVGDIVRSSRGTITDAHIVLFCGLSGDFNPLHTDDESAREAGFPCRMAHGMLGHAMSTGLRSVIDDWEIVAFLETRRRFIAPLFVGDTIHYDAEVKETRRSQSNPNRGIVKIELTLINQDQVTIQEGEDTFIVAATKLGGHDE